MSPIKVKTRILVIGFQSYNERMYPHLYDFLREIEKYSEVVCFGKDDRGQSLLSLGDLLCFRISKLTLGTVYRLLRYVCGQYSRKNCCEKYLNRKFLP